jgi:hypothetical protein
VLLCGGLGLPGLRSVAAAGGQQAVFVYAGCWSGRSRGALSALSAVAVMISM